MMRLRTYMAAVSFDRCRPHAFSIETCPEDDDTFRLMLDYQANHEMVCLYEGTETDCETVLDAALAVIDSGDPAPGTLDLREAIDLLDSDEGDEG